MGKKMTSERKKKKTLTSKRKTNKRGVNIGGVKVGNSEFSLDSTGIDQVRKAVGRATNGDHSGAVKSALKATQGLKVNIDTGDIESAAKGVGNIADHPLTGKLVDGFLNRQHIPRYESRQHSPEYHQQQNWPQQQPQQTYYPPAQDYYRDNSSGNGARQSEVYGTYSEEKSSKQYEGELPIAVPYTPPVQSSSIPGITKDHVDIAAYGAKSLLDVANSDPNIKKVADAAGNVADATGAAVTSAVTSAATPLLIQRTGTDAAVKAGEFGTDAAIESGKLGLKLGLNAGEKIGRTAIDGSNRIAAQSFGLASKILDAPETLFNAANWLASDPASINFIEKNGVGGRTKHAIKQKLLAILVLKIKGLEGKKKQYTDIIQNEIRTYRMRVRCRKDSSDLYYSNRGIVPAVFSYCDDEVNEIINDVENIKSDIVAKLDEQITSVKEEFQTILTKSQNIMDVDGYKKFYNEELQPELANFNDFANKKSEKMNEIYENTFAKLRKTLGRKEGGIKTRRNKSRRVKTTKKQKSLRKKRT